jgi:predicted TPR repeat methyltransferase
MNCPPIDAEPSGGDLAYADDERLALFYERHIVGDCDYRAPSRMAEMVEPCARAGTRWLDLGAGTGLVGEALAARGIGIELVAVDSSAAMLELIDSGLYVERVRADCRQRLPFDDATFAGAVACGLFEHIETTEPMWGELARVLEPGAPFIFTFPPRASSLAERVEREQTLAAHDAAALRRELETAGFEWRSAVEIAAYRVVHHGWVPYQLVSAARRV